THTITHPACNTADTTDVHTPLYVLFGSFLQYSSYQGRLVHKGDGGDALHTGKGDFYFCRILPLDRLICLCMSLSNQVTVVQSAYSHASNGPATSWVRVVAKCKSSQS